MGRTTKSKNLLASDGVEGLYDVIANSERFSSESRSIHGGPGSIGYPVDMSSLLDEYWRIKLNVEQDRITYIVWSYDTPIAWKTDDGWVQVDQKFSVTTSKWQSKLAKAIAQLES